MMRSIGIVAAYLALLATLVVAPVTHGAAEATPQASPEVMDMGGTGAAYMAIRNAGSAADRLIGGETAVAEIVEIHEIVDEGGMMEMRPLADGLEIPPGGAVTLEPGGYHVMLIGLTEDLTNVMTLSVSVQTRRR